jgi:hypothetical protein
LPSYRSKGRIAAAIGAYQLLIQKYYWGPNGPPKKDGQKKDSSQK